MHTNHAAGGQAADSAETETKRKRSCAAKPRVGRVRPRGRPAGRACGVSASALRWPQPPPANNKLTIPLRPPGRQGCRAAVRHQPRGRAGGGHFLMGPGCRAERANALVCGRAGGGDGFCRLAVERDPAAHGLSRRQRARRRPPPGRAAAGHGRKRRARLQKRAANRTPTVRGLGR